MVIQTFAKLELHSQQDWIGMRFLFSEVMDEVAQNVPCLEKIVLEIEGLAESGGKYTEAPHVIEVTLPMLAR
jgi:hypothetical protein